MAETEPVTERWRVREIDDDERRRLVWRARLLEFCRYLRSICRPQVQIAGC